MIDLQPWLDLFTNALHRTFPNRVWFVGLQGSYGRGEATEESDLDVVVILDELTPADVRTYSQMLDGLPGRELICGFLSGRAELLAWEASDLVQFYYDTTPIEGGLDELLPLLDSTAVDRAIRIGACNVYHGCVHNMVHEKSQEVLKALYKSAVFAVQAIVLRQTGIHYKSQKDLLTAASPGEREIVETFLCFKNGGEADFHRMSETLFSWAQRQIGKEFAT